MIIALQTPTPVGVESPAAATKTDTAPLDVALGVVPATTTPAVPVLRGGPNAFDSAGLWGPFLKTMLMLCVVLALVYLVLGKGMGKLMQRAQQGKRLKVIERVSLDARFSLYLVDVDGLRLVLGGGASGVNLLKELPPAADKGEPTSSGTPSVGRSFMALINKPATPTKSSSDIATATGEQA
jgi:flagellar biogenesis protein FliO